jgi:putative tryptophan/tyrosine transport system substrate-binding protein
MIAVPKDLTRIEGWVRHRATTNDEIDAAFATLARERHDALFVAADGFFSSRRVQFATLAAHERIPAAYTPSDFVEVGG